MNFFAIIKSLANKLKDIPRSRNRQIILGCAGMLLFAVFINATTPDWGQLETQLQAFAATLFAAYPKMDPTQVRIGPANAQYPISPDVQAAYNAQGKYISYNEVSTVTNVDQATYALLFESTLVHEFNHYVDLSMNSTYNIWDAHTLDFGNEALSLLGATSPITLGSGPYNNGFNFSEMASYYKEYTFLSQWVEMTLSTTYNAATQSADVDSVLSAMKFDADVYNVFLHLASAEVPSFNKISYTGAQCCSENPTTDSTNWVWQSAITPTLLQESTGAGFSVQITADPNNPNGTLVNYLSFTSGSPDAPSEVTYNFKIPLSIPFQPGDTQNPAGSTAFFQQATTLAAAKINKFAAIVAKKTPAQTLYNKINDLTAKKAAIDANGGIVTKHSLSSTTNPGGGTQVMVPAFYPGLPTFTTQLASIYAPTPTTQYYEATITFPDGEEYVFPNPLLDGLQTGGQ